jgi:NADH-ubiquinone oxidoreductase chain 5
LLVGEGVGVCSFLLINFWFTRFQANKAAIKAMVVNRIGDAALTLAIFVGLCFFGTVSFSEMPLVCDEIWAFAWLGGRRF